MKQVVLITGGTSGIGLGLAEAFMGRGDAVAVCGRSQTALKRFSDAHPDALAIQADVTITEARIAMLEAVADRFGQLGVLINNAGTTVERNFAADPDVTNELEQEIALNLTAPIQLTGGVLSRWPALSAIVFVTSGYALVSPTRAPTYGAVKAGLHGFAEGLRGQLAPKGTHVLELLPPLVDTPMTANLTGKKISPAEVAAVTGRSRHRLCLRAPIRGASRLQLVLRDQHLPGPNCASARRRSRALRAVARRTRSTGIPARLCWHNAPERLKHRTAPRFRFPGRWLLPSRWLEGRRLARRRVDAARPSSRGDRPPAPHRR